MRTYLAKPIRMSTDYGQIPRLWIRVTLWNVLFHRQVEDLLLRMSCSSWVFSYVLGLDCVFFDDEAGRHVGQGFPQSNGFKRIACCWGLVGMALNKQPSKLMRSTMLTCIYTYLYINGLGVRVSLAACV